MVALLVALVAALAVRATLLDDHVSAVPTAEAVDRFRDDTTGDSSPAVVPASLPAPGVYRYRTEGGESIDAVGGATHTYPAETTITVRPDGCGVTLQWDALRERNERWSLCVGGAAGVDVVLQPTGGSYHQFFGREQIEDLVCDRGVVVLPAPDGASPAAVGDPTVSVACTLGGRPVQQEWQVLDLATRIVDGRSIEVRHVQFRVIDDDHYFEHITMDWFLDPHGLPVEIRLREASLADTAFGDVRYDEHYTLVLVSLDPLT